MTPLSIEIIHSAEAIPRAAWDRLCPPAQPFLNGDFFAILERHGAAGPQWGWAAHHLVARQEDGAVVGILPLYLKSNAYGDFTGDWGWAGAYRQAGKDYFPRLLTGLPHTPATGPRLLVVAGKEGAAVRAALIAAAQNLTAAHGLSSWHVAFPDNTDLEALRAAGLLVSNDVQFHWHDAGVGDFDGYLGTFSSARRRKVRAERKRVAESGLILEVRHGDEIAAAEWPALHALYAATFEKFDNHAVFTAGCFADLAAALGRRMVLFIARDPAGGGAPVALSLCFRNDEALYGRYWGTRVAIDSLHFELCFYQGIAYCLREGLTRFEPGAGGEHKIARGFQPTVVHSAHWIADARMRTLIGRHLDMQRDAVAGYRDEAATHLPFRQES
jgi:predicted N-acyltransferase